MEEILIAIASAGTGSLLTYVAMRVRLFRRVKIEDRFAGLRRYQEMKDRG